MAVRRKTTRKSSTRRPTAKRASAAKPRARRTRRSSPAVQTVRIVIDQPAQNTGRISIKEGQSPKAKKAKF